MSTENTTEVRDILDSDPPADAMETILDRVVSPVDLCIQKGMDAMDKLCSLFNKDAMYVITGYIEPLRNYGHPSHDCMDVLVETRTDAMDLVTGFIEPVIFYGQPKQDCMDVLVEPEEIYALVDPLVGWQLKNCSVRLERINDVLSFVPKNDVCSAVLNRGQPHTHSQCTPKPPHTPRHPRAAHREVSYHDPEVTSKEEHVQKRHKPNSVGSDPSDSRMLAQNAKTDHPKQHEFTILSDTPVTSDTGNNNDQSDADTIFYTPPDDDPGSEQDEPTPKGKFTIQTKKLRKPHTYNCLFCDKNFDSAKCLVKHHNKSHKIMYCGECSRAFHNLTT